MSPPEPEPSAYDEFLDRLLNGEALDASEFLKRHPELSETECRHIREICEKPPDAGQATATTGVPGSSTQADSPPVERIGGYRLKRRIGAGGMGVVFLADDEALGREVAVKILGPDLLGKEERANRFLREIRAVARLRHPNIVVVHDSGEQDGFRYMVMEYVPGSSLQDVVASVAAHGTRLSPADAVRWGIEIGRALHEAHAAGIVHRDVKPSNVRITTGGRAVLLDFGLAQEDGAASLTESGGFRGSPQYASPEQVADDRGAVDARTDVYSLGATLYEVLTGVAPFRGETRQQLFHNILTRDPVPPRRLEPSIPRDLETVIVAAIEKEPERRYATAAALVADLEAVQAGRPISIRPVSAAGRLARWARRQPAKAALAATLAVATLIVSALGGYIAANRGKIATATAAERARTVAGLLQEAFLEHGEGVDLARAEMLFEEAFRIDPDCEEAQAGVAMSRTARGDAQGALAFLDELASRRTTDAWRELLRADALAKQGKPADAKAFDGKIDRSCTALGHFIFGSRLLNRYHAGAERSAKPAFDQLRLAVLQSVTAKERYFQQLGHAAWHAGRHEEAREIAAAIGQLFPDSPERWLAIGMTLTDADPAGSVAAYEKASRAPPRALRGRALIVGSLSKSGRDDLVEVALGIARAMVAEAPTSADSHSALGTALQGKGALKDAIAEFREVVRLLPGYGHLDLAEALVEAGDYDGAIAPAREAIRLRPREPSPRNLLGVALRHAGRNDEAVASFEAVLKIVPNDACALCNLGRGLLQQGEFVRGLERLRKGHEIGSKDPRWKYPSASWVSSASELVALEKRLDAVRRGVDAPNAADCTRLAYEVCRRKRLFAEAARLYAKAFELDASFMSQRTPDYVLEAATSAVQAGLGEAADPPQGASERKDLLARARGWFVERLESSEELVQAQPALAASVAATLEEWRKAPGLSAVRPPSATETLPADDAAAWRALWARLDRLAPPRSESAPAADHPGGPDSR
jgi:tetratricopeptide (TPR) repeat protein